MLPRMKRVVFIFLLIAYLAILTAWLRSIFSNDWIVFHRETGTGQVAVIEIGWAHGRCYFEQSEGEFAAMHTHSGSQRMSGESGWSIWSLRCDQDVIELLGIEYWRGGGYLLHVSFWIPVTMMSGVFAVMLVKWRRKKLAGRGFPVKSNDKP